MAIDYTKRPKPVPEEAPPAPAPASVPVSLGKVTLTKSSPAVSLTKGPAAGGGGGGILRVNLRWTARPPAPAPPPAPAEKQGFLKRMTAAAQAQMAAAQAQAAPGIDLDLACLYEYTDGSKGVVQALGNAFHDQHTFGTGPICRLDGDDRTGGSAGENLFVDLGQAAAIRRVLIFAFIYEGVPNWAAADGVVTLFAPDGGQVEIKLDEADNTAPLCAIAMLSNDGSGIAVRREVQYIHGSQSVLDAAYSWGMQWTKGSK